MRLKNSYPGKRRTPTFDAQFQGKKLCLGKRTDEYGKLFHNFSRISKKISRNICVHGDNFQLAKCFKKRDRSSLVTTVGLRNTEFHFATNGMPGSGGSNKTPVDHPQPPSPHAFVKPRAGREKRHSAAALGSRPAKIHLLSMLVAPPPLAFQLMAQNQFLPLGLKLFSPSRHICLLTDASTLGGQIS